MLALAVALAVATNPGLQPPSNSGNPPWVITHDSAPIERNMCIHSHPIFNCDVRERKNQNHIVWFVLSKPLNCTTYFSQAPETGQLARSSQVQRQTAVVHRFRTLSPWFQFRSPGAARVNSQPSLTSPHTITTGRNLAA